MPPCSHAAPPRMRFAQLSRKRRLDNNGVQALDFVAGPQKKEKQGRVCRSDLLGLKRPLVHLFVHDGSSGCCCQQQQVNYECSCRTDCRSLRCRWLLSPRHRHHFESKRAMQSPLHAHAAAWKARWVLYHYYRLLRCICSTPLDDAGRTACGGGRGAKVIGGGRCRLLLRS